MLQCGCCGFTSVWWAVSIWLLGCCFNVVRVFEWFLEKFKGVMGGC